MSSSFAKGRAVRQASFVFILSCLGCFAGTSFGGEFDPLLAKLPPAANAVLLLNADRVFDSPLAKQENWKENYDQAFAAGLIGISPELRRVALSAQWDWAEKRPLWTVAAAESRGALSFANIARSHKVVLDNIDGRPAVPLRNDTYVVDFSQQIVGVMSPANRQAVARWARDAAAKTTPQLSPFLTTALRDADQDAIVQALDLVDAFAPAVVRAKLKSSPVFQQQSAELEKLTKVAASIEGLLLEIRLTDRITGRVILVFGEDAAPLAPFAQGLLLEVLTENGLALDDLKTWKMTTGGKQVILQGDLSKGGLKRIFSVMDQSLTNVTAGSEPREKEDDAAYNLEKYGKPATLKYFAAVGSNLRELKVDVKDAATWGHMAQYMDYGARQIDRLPQLDVDAEMLNYGAYVATQLRNISGALRGIGINSGSRGAGVNSGGGYYSNYEVGQQRRAISAEERAKGATDARNIVPQIEDATAKIRRAMTTKYHAEFK